MLFATIAGYRVPILSVSLQDSAGRIGTFDVEVDAGEIPIEADGLLYADVLVTQNGTQLAAGFVAAFPRKSRSRGRWVYDLSCDTYPGLLAQEMALDIQFQDTLISTALATLLAGTQTTSWSLASIASLNDEPITLDVRDRETIWAQIEMVLDGARYPTFVRYAGESGGVHRLEAGSFGDERRDLPGLTDGLIIGEPRFEQTVKDLIKEIRPISGKVGGAPVPLSEALVIDPTLASDPVYPIVGESIVNQSIARGKRLRRRYTAHKTANTSTPTAQERAEVALSMYWRARREMEAGASPYENLTVDCVMGALPALHDRIWLSMTGTVQEAFNPLIQQVVKKTVPIAGWYRVIDITVRDAIQMEANGTQGMRVQLRLTNSDEIDRYDPNSLVMQRFETNDLQDNMAVASGELARIAVSVTHSAVSSDCSAGTYNGKTFDFPMPVVPAGANKVTAVVQSVNPSTCDTGTIVQNAALPGDNEIRCISGPGPGDYTGQSITATVVYIFTE